MNKLLTPFDLMLTRSGNFQRILKRSEDFFLLTRDGFDLELLKVMMGHEQKETQKILFSFDESRSQLRQDLLVLWLLDFQKDGIFVEFGATDGVDLSNTYLLERKYGWKGLLVEPAKIWHHDLKQNRNSIIDFRAVTAISGEMEVFFQSEDPRFSSIFRNLDLSYPSSYQVKTVTLKDLLIEHAFPELIDYISIDTEGTEFEILKNFDFDLFKFKVATIEYSSESSREQVCELMSRNGYKRVFDSISKFEGWFINPNFVKLAND